MNKKTIKLNFKEKKDPKWKRFFEGKWRKAILVGGRSFGKTFKASLYPAINSYQNPFYKTVVFREVLGQTRDSIFDETLKRFLMIREKSGGWRSDVFEIKRDSITATNKIWNKSKQEWDKITQDCVISSGLRKSRLEQTTAQKGLSSMNLAIIDEAEDARDKDQLLKLEDTIKQQNSQIIYALNTPDLDHWLVQKYFDYEKIEGTEFYRLFPKKGLEGMDDVCIVQGDYRDSSFISETVKKEYESYANPNHINYDLNHYYKDILGYATEK